MPPQNHRFALPRRYVRKNKAAHAQSCESISCRFALSAPDGTQLGCGWQGHKSNKYNHVCTISSSRDFKVVRDCYDYLMRQIEAKEDSIASLRDVSMTSELL